MKLFESIEELSQAHLGNLCVTIGNFDGVHMGHQSILKRLKELASHYPDCQTLLITFEPQPLEFFNAPVARIFTNSQKCDLLNRYDLIDNLLVIKFDQNFAGTDPESFITSICKAAQIKTFLVGDDFRFGKNRSGSFETFLKLQETLGYKVENLNTIKFEGDRVSSTKIRQFLADGDFATANHLLIEPFYFEGEVVHGKKLARTLNCPTANIAINRKKCPIRGTYFCKVEILEEAQEFCGICNIGLKPTIDETNKTWLCEVHILNFEREIYGKTVKVIPLEKHRDEIKFDSIEALKHQVDQDIDLAYKYFKLTKTK